MSLLDKASLIVTPNAVKESKLYSVIPSSGAGDMDVVRATTATRVNSAGLIEQSPYNLLQQSENFGNTAFWGVSEVSITINATTAPNGTTTADKLVESSANLLHEVYTNAPYSLIAGSNYTKSVYAKSAERTQIALNFVTGGFGQGSRVIANLTNGTLGTITNYGGVTESSATITNVGNGWYRISLTIKPVTTQDFYVDFAPVLNGNPIYQGNGTSGVFIWGAQLEVGNILKDYFATTNRLNVPRIDYTNGSCPSLLVEPQRTNLQAYSNDFNLWTLSNTTVTANNGISPDGTQNADRVQFSTGGLMYYGSNGSAGSNTLTVYAKAKNGVSANFRFFANGATLFSSNQTATGTWKRFTFTYTYTALTVGLAIATTGADDILFYGFQHELGTYPTSYIPTVASSVTRNADVISKTGISSLIGQTEGTLFIDLNFKNLNQLGGVDTLLTLNNGTTANEISILLDTPSGANKTILGYIRNASTNEVVLYAPTTITETRYKIALSYKLNDVVLYVNGTQIGTDTSAAIPTTSVVSLNSRSDGSFLNTQQDYINSVQLYKTRLTNSELQSITTL